jgi:hypothetical protein
MDLFQSTLATGQAAAEIEEIDAATGKVTTRVKTMGEAWAEAGPLGCSPSGDAALSAFEEVGAARSHSVRPLAASSRRRSGSGAPKASYYSALAIGALGDAFQGNPAALLAAGKFFAAAAAFSVSRVRRAAALVVAVAAPAVVPAPSNGARQRGRRHRWGGYDPHAGRHGCLRPQQPGHGAGVEEDVRGATGRRVILVAGR